MTLAETLLLKQPWLIVPDSLQAMSAVAQTFLANPRELPQRGQSSLLTVENGVGVVTMSGPMIRNPDLLSQILFNAVDTEEITAAVREAANRPDIEAVFLDIDSPGGTVTGTPELAQAVADAGKQKPVYAFSSGLMCSAAYWVASQAQAIYVTPSARVGSIGVIQPIIDDSEAFKNAGLKVEVFAAGKFKSIGMPGVSLTDSQRECIQSNIEEWATYQSRISQPMPSLAAQAMNVAGAVVSEAAAIVKSEPPVPPEEAQRRYAICEQCDCFNVVDARCSKCGCYMRVKTAFRSATCPDGKWAVVDTVPSA